MLIRLAAIWDALTQERGADRICWFLVLISTPLFGLAAYICIALRERDERINYSATPGNGLREPSPQSLDWAQAKLEKELNTPANTEREWIGRYLKNKPAETHGDGAGRYIKTALILITLVCFAVGLYYLNN
jgi:hypothetical protein